MKLLRGINAVLLALVGTVSVNAAAGDIVQQILAHDAAIWSVYADPTYVYSGSADKIAKQWNIADGSLVRTFTGHTSTITSVFVNNGYLFTGAQDFLAKQWDLSSGSLVFTFSGHTAAINAVFVSGDMLFTGSSDKNIKLWSIAGQSLTRTFTGHTNFVWSVFYDGSFLYSGAGDNNIIKWDIATGSKLLTMVDTSRVLTVYVQGNYLYSGSGNFFAKKWDLTTGTVVQTYTGHTSDVRSVIPIGDYLFTGSFDNTLKQWNIADGSLVRTYVGHTNTVRSVSYNGANLFSGANDKLVIEWDIGSTVAPTIVPVTTSAPVPMTTAVPSKSTSAALPVSTIYDEDEECGSILAQIPTDIINIPDNDDCTIEIIYPKPTPTPTPTPFHAVEHSAWYYPRGETIDQIVGAVNRIHVDYLVTSAGANLLGNATFFADQVAFFNQIIVATGIKRMALMTLQDTSYALNNSIPTAQALVQNTVALCLAMNQAAGHVVCDEIHYDIEPWSMSQWTSTSDWTIRQGILDQMTQVLAAMRATINAASPSFYIKQSASMTWWLYSKPLLCAALVENLDLMYIMSYGGTGGTVASILTDIANKQGSPEPSVVVKPYNAGVGIKMFLSASDAYNASVSVEAALSVTDAAYLGNSFYNLNFAV